MSYATILLPSSNIIASYTTAAELDNALGIYLITWFMFTFMMFIAALRKNVGFIALLGFLWVTFLLLAVSKFTGSVACNTAGGAFGIITAFIAYYCALSELLVFEESYFMMPLGGIAKRSA